MRDEKASSIAKNAVSSYKEPQVFVCIYDAMTPLTEVMLSSVLNDAHKDAVVRTVLDKMTVAHRLVTAWNADVRLERAKLKQSAAAAGGAAAASAGGAEAAAAGAPRQLLDHSTVTYPQLNALSALLGPNDKGHGAKVFSPEIFSVFHFCMIYGESVLSSENYVWQSASMDEHDQPMLLPTSWLGTIATALLKDIDYMPTARQLGEMKRVKPWLRDLPSVAEYIIHRVLHCRDFTTGNKNLPIDDPAHCSTLVHCKRVTTEACAVYLQHMAALGQAHMYIRGSLGWRLKFLGLPNGDSLPCPWLVLCLSSFRARAQDQGGPV